MDDVTAFSQRDPRWAKKRLGFSKLTIGEAGCLISSVASLLADWGVATDPHRLNQYLKRNSGYVDDNRFVWAAVNGLACRFVRLIECRYIPAPVAEIRELLEAGCGHTVPCGVVACVDAQPGGEVQKHWVRITDYTDGTDGAEFRIMDPWRIPGEEMGSLGRYLAPGWGAARAIFAAGIYRRSDERRTFVVRADDEEYQEEICMYGGQGT